MPVKIVRRKHIIEFDTGAFDNWCVFLTRPGQQRYAPKDTEYFTFLKDLSNIVSSQKIYDDFVSIYAITGKKIESRPLKLISQISVDYKNYRDEIDIWFCVIYAGMIAENNKENAILKKRIKRLGMYQLLIENLSPEEAANFSKGKNWKDLDLLMKERGF